MKKLTILFFICLLASCTKQANKQLSNIENIMLAQPDSAFTLLQKDSASICKEGTDAQIYYQIIRCRVADLLYIPHTSDSTMLKVANYYTKQNNQKALSMAYYCLGCIYRDLKEHPRAINYFLKSINTDSTHTPKEMIGRCYYQLSGFEDNRKNPIKALEYEIKAYNYISLTKDYTLANNCLINIAQDYKTLGNDEKYSAFINLAKNKISATKDTINLARFIIAKGQIAIQGRNNKKLKTLINEGKKILPTILKQQEYGFYLMQGYYYKELHQVDSASYYFQKVLNIGNPIMEYEANTALSETNAENREYTTAWKFLNKAIKLRNAIDSIDNKQEAEKMKASYNYELEVAKREEAEESKNRYKYAMLLGIICILGLTTLILAHKNASKEKSIKQLKLIAQQNELIKNQEQKIEEQKNMMHEHESNIKKLETRNNELSKYQLTSSEHINKRSKNIKLDDDRWNQFRMSESYYKLHKMIKNGLDHYTNSEQKQVLIDIMATIDNLFNEYGKRLTAFLPGLKDAQLEFAYLIKAEINFSNIAILLRKSKPSITKISKSFDEYLEKNMKGLDIKTFLHDF
ncbi:hypothetical protein F7D34_02850 [Prevotella copri]|uniref:Uncharacterized protein n=1 Tax=Segatella copri TaxID=165179 RepID=A0A646HHX3_9BACT|nr:hypothetical protein [Segatella copri]MQN89142.1 hypothetical protein [Segatella copri]MQO76935.1 hypothetical protein [Segatella copri]